jgi:hypothetical protein
MGKYFLPKRRYLSASFQGITSHNCRIWRCAVENERVRPLFKIFCEAFTWFANNPIKYIYKNMSHLLYHLPLSFPHHEFLLTYFHPLRSSSSSSSMALQPLWALAAFLSSLIYTQSVGLLWWAISPSKGRYLHTEQTYTNIDASSGSRTHVPCVRAREGG